MVSIDNMNISWFSRKILGCSGRIFLDIQEVHGHFSTIVKTKKHNRAHTYSANGLYDESKS